MHPTQTLEEGPPSSLTTPPPRRSERARSFLRSVWAWHWPLVLLAALMVITGVVSAVGYLIDDRVLMGNPVWAKALKFSLSFGIYALTLAWMIKSVARPRMRKVVWWAGTVVALATFLEMVAITLQVVRGVQSHFNMRTPFDSTVWIAMGGFISIIFGAALVVGIIVMFTPTKDISIRWGVRLGVIISTLGLSTGFLMLAPSPEQAALGDDSPAQGAHSVGVADGGPSVPFLGWSTTGGDVRISHFIGLHALQFLPLLAILLAMVARGLNERTRTRLVMIAAAAYAAVFALTLWQALRGQPITSPDAVTVVVAVAIGIGTALAVYTVLRHARRQRHSVNPLVSTTQEDHL